VRRWSELGGKGLGAALLLAAPAAYGLAYLVLTFRQLPTPVMDLVRPGLAIGLCAVLLALTMWVALRSLARGSVVASVLVLAVSAPFLLVAAVAGGALAAGIQLLRGRWRIAQLSWDLAGSSVAKFGLGLLLVSLGLALPAVPASVPASSSPGGETTAPVASTPNVYLLMLDGYPRADTLQTLYGHDNSSFEANLARRGFSVASASHSNYSHSWLTMTSMLHGAFMDDIAGLARGTQDPAEQYRSLMAALNDGAMVRRFRENGYEVDAIPPPFRSLALSTADRYLDGGQMTDFEYSLLTNSHLSGPVLTLWPDLLVDQERDRFGHALATAEALARERLPGPRLLLAHIFSPPHAPLVYGRSGEQLPMADCVPNDCALWEFPDDEAWAGLGDQVAYVNSRLLPTLDAIIGADPTAVIVLMSDHGSRRSSDDVDEYFMTFFAARTPGRHVFPDDPSPVNVLRRLGQEYLHTETASLTYRRWHSPIENLPLSLVER